MTSLILPPSVSLNANPQSGLMPLYPWAWRGVLASYTPMLGNRSNKVLDFGPYRLSGSLSNFTPSTHMPAVTVEGQHGYSWLFSVGRHINLGDAPHLELSEFAIEAWASWDHASNYYDAMVAKHTNSNNSDYFNFVMGRFATQKFWFAHRPSGSGFQDHVSSYTIPNDGILRHYRIEVKGGNVRFIVNGGAEHDQTMSLSGTIETTYGDLRIGYSGRDNQYWEGKIASVAIGTLDMPNRYKIGPLGPYQGELPQASPRYGIGFQQVDYSYNKLFGLGSHSEDANLEGWWHLQDDAATTTVVDQSSNGIDATFNGGNTEDKTQTGPNSYLTKALRTAGTDYIARAISQSSTPWTMGGWFHDSGSGDSAMTFSDSSSSNTQYLISATSTYHQYAGRGGGLFAFIIRPSTGGHGTWKQVIGVSRSTSSFEAYVDGVSVGTATDTVSSFTADNINIGRWGDSTPTDVDGEYAGVFLFSRDLSDVEASEAYNGPEPVFTVDPTFTITSGLDYSITLGTAEIDQTVFSGGSNGTVSYEWRVIKTNTGDIVQSGIATSGPITGTLPAPGKYHVTVQPFNDGGMDVDELFTSDALNATDKSLALVHAALQNTLSGTDDITVEGFGSVTGCIAFASRAGDPNTNAAHNPLTTRAGLTAGIYDGTDRFSIYMEADGGETTDEHNTREMRNDSILQQADAWRYDISSITDGVRITMDVEDTSTNPLASFILFKGVQCKAMKVTPNSSNGGTVVSGSIGFTPKSLICLTHGDDLAAGDVFNAVFSIGFATESGDSQLAAMLVSDNIPTQNSGTVQNSSNYVAAQPASSGPSPTWRLAATSWDSDTVTFTTTGNTGGDDVIVMFFDEELELAMGRLNGSDVADKDGDSVTIDTGSIDPEIVFAVQPTVSTFSQSDPCEGFAIGASNGNDQRSVNWMSEDNVSTTNVSSRASENDLIWVEDADGTFARYRTGEFRSGEFDMHYENIPPYEYGFYVAMQGPPVEEEENNNGAALQYYRHLTNQVLR